MMMIIITISTTITTIIVIRNTLVCVYETSMVKLSHKAVNAQCPRN